MLKVYFISMPHGIQYKIFAIHEYGSSIVVKFPFLGRIELLLFIRRY